MDLLWGMVWQRVVDFHTQSGEEPETGKPFVKVQGILWDGGDFIRKVFQQGATVILSAVHQDRLWKLVEDLSPGKSGGTAEGFRYGIRIRENGDHPSDGAPGCGVHPCGKSRTDSDLFFKDLPAGLTFYRDPDKEIKYEVVTLPQLIDKERFFPECEVAVQAVPLTHAFPAVTDHLGWYMGQKPVYSPTVVRDAHVFAGRFTGGYPRIR